MPSLEEYHGCPVAKSTEDEASTDDTDTVEDISDGLTHPHAPIQDDASEPTPILPIKRETQNDAQTPAERDGGNRPFLVQSSCTGTQSLRYQDPLRFAKTCDPTQVSPILTIIDGIAWTIVGSAILSGALLATLDDRHKHYVMVVGAPAIYGPVPMLVSISAWLPPIVMHKVDKTVIG